MNVTAILKAITDGAKSVCGTAWIFGKRHAPEIMIGGGILGFGLTVFETVKATNKTNDILEEKEARIQRFTALYNGNDPENPEYTMVAFSTDVEAANNKTRWELVKTWAPVATTGVASVILVLYGYRVLNGRYVATAAAYKALESGFEHYRKNVIDEFGKEADWRMLNTYKADELEAAKKEREEKKALTDGKEAKKRPKTRYANDINRRIFDCNTSDRWQKYWLPEQALDFIGHVERQLQDKVNIYGFALLNDAFDMLGMPRTSDGAVVGWIRTKHCKHNMKGEYVSLGFANDETPEEEIRRILSSGSNEDIWIRLMPNTDGVIYQFIDRPYSER